MEGILNKMKSKGKSLELSVLFSNTEKKLDRSEKRVNKGPWLVWFSWLKCCPVK